MRVVLFIIIFTLILTLCGCDVLNRSYTDITPHQAEVAETSDGVAERVETYAGLKSAILNLVEQGLESGVIRMYSYPGDANADVRAACRETMFSEPLGAYAVEYVGYECTRILAYYEAVISITYRRTAEQIAAVREVSGNEFRAAVTDLYLSGGKELVAYLSYYYDDPRFDPAAIIEEVHYERPLDAFIVPEVSLTMYPDTGYRRIVELSLDYGVTYAQLTEMKSNMNGIVVNSFDPENGVNITSEYMVDSIAATLYETVSYTNPETSPYAATAYGALVESAASDKGFAMAFKAALDARGINNIIVRGYMNGAPRTWNLVEMYGFYYHYDVPLGLDFECKTDAEFFETHEYINPSAYPACDGPAIETAAPADDENITEV